jgi:putative membrane protein
MRHDDRMKNLLIRWVALAAAFWVSAALITGITVSGGAWSYFWIALIFGLINAFLGTLVRVVTLPLTILTLGLFLLVINTAMLYLTSKVTDALAIDGFWSAFLGALVITVISGIFGKTARKVTS